MVTALWSRLSPELQLATATIAAVVLLVGLLVLAGGLAWVARFALGRSL